MTKEKIITLNQKHEQEGRYTTVDDCISTINEDRIKHNLKGIAYVYLTVEDGKPAANYGVSWDDGETAVNGLSILGAVNILMHEAESRV
ncbi:hypothetical protein EFM54_00805 [Lentilactobacillus buchneri]|uniref:hypothetical protein n=1 Tax=Lentilactobacillus buchneri TaxID=1581 RepID=UPI0021A27DC0|nr:hypothetical protein [Lentilactobacillus buchneri]MCT2897571.1 hypothetical protein [Lentilactobacillus buchneri]